MNKQIGGGTAAPLSSLIPEVTIPDYETFKAVETWFYVLLECEFASLDQGSTSLFADSFHAGTRYMAVWIEAVELVRRGESPDCNVSCQFRDQFYHVAKALRYVVGV